MTDLKKCPFPSCGSDETEVDCICDVYQVCCFNCGAQGPRSESEAEAIDLWNTRTGLDREKVLELAAALKDYFDGQLDISESFKRGFRYGVDMVVGKIFDIEYDQREQGSHD